MAETMHQIALEIGLFSIFGFIFWIFILSKSKLKLKPIPLTIIINVLVGLFWLWWLYGTERKVWEGALMGWLCFSIITVFIAALYDMPKSEPFP